MHVPHDLREHLAGSVTRIPASVLLQLLVVQANPLVGPVHAVTLRLSDRGCDERKAVPHPVDTGLDVDAGGNVVPGPDAERLHEGVYATGGRQRGEVDVRQVVAQPVQGRIRTVARIDVNKVQTVTHHGAQRHAGFPRLDVARVRRRGLPRLWEPEPNRVARCGVGHEDRNPVFGEPASTVQRALDVEQQRGHPAVRMHVQSRGSHFVAPIVTGWYGTPPSPEAASSDGMCTQGWQGRRHPAGRLLDRPALVHASAAPELVDHGQAQPVDAFAVTSLIGVVSQCRKSSSPVQTVGPYGAP
jgi:hypothetical protein